MQTVNYKLSVIFMPLPSFLMNENSYHKINVVPRKAILIFLRKSELCINFVFACLSVYSPVMFELAKHLQRDFAEG